jgi:hypothetical protein
MSEEAAPAVDGGVKPSSKRSSGGAVKPRKSAGGAKKGSAAQEVAKCEYGDIVLARLRGFPPWREYCPA